MRFIVRFIVQANDGHYLTARRPSGRRYPEAYMARASWSDDIDDAKIFNTKSAAVNSARQSGGDDDFNVLSVTLSVHEEA